MRLNATFARRRYSLAAFMSLLCSYGLCSNGLTYLGRDSFQLGPYRLTDGSSEEFRVVDLEVGCNPSREDPLGQTENFAVYWPDRGDRVVYEPTMLSFRYSFCVTSTSNATHGWKVVARAISKGSFSDDIVDVPLSIGNEATSLRLPIHNSGSTGFLVFTQPNNVPSRINLETGEGLQVQVKNTLPNLPVVLTSVSVTFSDPSLWEPHAPGVSNLNLEAPPGQTISLPHLNLRPKLLNAFLTQFTPNANPFDTKISVRVDYCPASGGRPGVATTDLPIQFVPMIPTLFLLAGVGALIGTAGRLVRERILSTQNSSSAGKSTDVVGALMAGVSGALLLEFLGLLLVFLKSKLVIFGYEISPFQVLPVLAAGLLVGLFGVSVVGFAKKQFNIGDSQ